MKIVSVDTETVIVEFLGTARLRAGRTELHAHGRTVADVLAVVIDNCPKLAGLFTDTGAISKQFLISLDGERFVDDPMQVVPVGSRLLILGADAGG